MHDETTAHDNDDAPARRRGRRPFPATTDRPSRHRPTLVTVCGVHRCEVLVQVMPMFPLGSVLLPHMVLPLHVFEPRYRALMDDVLASDGRFGVVLISRGHEVGGADQRTDVGTVAEIVEARRLEDGRWAVVAMGVRRLRVVRWLDDDPYPRAEVEVLDLADELGDDTDGATALRDTAVARLRGVLARAAELGDTVAPATAVIADDPVTASFHATALAPIGPLDQQRLLAMPDATARLEALVETFTELDEDLRLRLAMLDDQDASPGGASGPRP